MNVNSARKIGFFAALSISLGSVVGIGIFLKNSSIIRAQMIQGTNDFSFWGLIISWILASIISLCAAYSFTQISTSKVGKSGLSGWIEQIGGKKQGFLIKHAHSGVYYSILTSVLPFLAVEGLFKAINDAVNGGNTTLDYYWVFIGGFVVLVFLSCFNYFSIKNSAKFQMFGTITKIIPLVLVAIIGLVGANNSHILDQPGSVENGVNTSTGIPVVGVPVTNMISFSGIFLALPAVLFSFDSFLTIGNMGNDVDKPEKTIPLVAVVTIVIAAIIYIFISIGAGLTGTGDAASIISTIVGKDNVAAKNTINIIVNILITLSAIFVANALSMATLRSCEGLVEEKQVMLYEKFLSLNNKRENLGGFVLYWIQLMFYVIILAVPAAIINSDAILDSATNAPVVIFFLAYAYTIGLGIKDKYTTKICKQVKGYVYSSVIAIVFILIVFVYIFFYQNIYVVSTTENRLSNSGLFFANSIWTQRDDAILFWTLFLWTIAWPLINFYVVNKKNKIGATTVK